MAVGVSVQGAIPVITQQPQRTNVVVGESAIFQVAASGTVPLAYQWRLAGTNLPNATNATLVLSNVQMNQGGGYRAVVSNAEGSVTSLVAQLTVRAPNTSVYLAPPGGWTYRYNGDAMAVSDTAALDGTWNHANGSDAWAGDLRGLANAPPGGLSISNGVLTMEDVSVSGTGNDNRRLYFTHPLSQDTLTNANTILGDGVTFTFRARLTPPTDPFIELTNAPDGFINVADGKGMVGMRQSGSSGMIISFSLNTVSEDTNDFPAAGLHMNNLNGNSRGPNVDPGEGGTLNVFAVNPTEFHEFWITVQDNGADAGTHRVSVYADGSTNPVVFDVTAGIGSDTPITNYLAIGMPSTIQRGAFDLDWVGYKQGVHVPQEADVLVEILSQPTSQTVNEGQTATFAVAAAGTPPITYQWFRNGAPIGGATEATYTTGPLLPPDNLAQFTVRCQNSAGRVTSEVATVTVITDNVPPVLVTAGSLDGQSIGLCFSERVTSASAQNTANYIINNGAVTVTLATLRTNANGTTVLLQVSGLSAQAGTAFTVRATNIVDASFTGNSGGGIVQGVVHGLTASNIGAANGTTFTCASNRFEMTANGAGLAGTADVFHFASMPRTNEFDVRVRLAHLLATNASGQAGLVARADLTDGSRSINAFVTPLPGDDAYHATYRSTTGGSTAAWPGGSDKAGVPLPNAWIRLTRAGDTFTAYHGTNGTQWQSYAQVTQSLPATLVVGIVGANLGDSVMDELIFIAPPTILASPANTVATNGDTVTFSVVATSQAEIRYQWRYNGADLLNQTNATLLLGNVTPGQTGTYDVRVSNGGGSVLSAPATLIIRTLDYGDASAVYPTLLANNGARHVLVPGVRIGAAVDFELDGFPGVAANGDDLNGSDDEDGVTFLSPLWVGQTATVAVVASTNGILNAWIDYGADGSFAQPQDHVFVDVALAPGTNQLNLVVPVNAVSTNTFARFRFSTVSGLAPAGIATDGEVEDYLVAIIPVADLSIVGVDFPDPIAVSSNLTYHVTITNTGPSLARNVIVTNRFSSSVEFVSATSTRGSCTNVSGMINCGIGDLGVTSNDLVTVIVKPLQTGTLSSTFGIYSDQPDPNTANNVSVSTTSVGLAPSITTPPASMTVTQGNTATFSVGASGTVPLSFQWFFNSAIVPNGTNGALTITNAQNANQGSYHVRVTNRVGGVLSPVVTLTVLDPPTISQQPQSRTNLAGSVATFSVTAQGTPPVFYQWFFNATNSLTGATNASLTLSNVQKSQSGVYSVRVSNSAGALDSAAAVLTVIEMDFGDAPVPFPTLLAANGARHRIVPGFYLGAGVDFEPDAEANDGVDEDGVIFRSPFLLGQSTTIEVIASSNGVLNAWVDWNGNASWTDAGEKIFGDLPLTAGTNVLSATVPLSAQLGARAARFRFSTAAGLSFTNEAANGEVEDYQVNVQPNADLAVTASADPLIVRLGSNVVYTVRITDAGPSTASGVVLTSAFPVSVTVLSVPTGCTNQNGVISCTLGSFGAGSSSTLTFTTRPDQTGNVTNIVTVAGIESDANPANNVAQAVVGVFEAPGIAVQPQNVTIVSGESASFHVMATGNALTYQWTFNGATIPGATSSMLVINPALPANEGTYRVRVSNAVGEVLSDPAQLTVLVPPAIATQPTNVTVVEGSSATFTVVASGTPPLSYQRSFGVMDLPGATNATLTLSSVSSTNEGPYRVRVWNEAGNVFSDTATLTVLVGVSIVQPPQDKTAFVGGQATMQVVAVGTQPISYQWFFNGTNRLNGATNATLVLSNVQMSHTGPYTVFVSNRVSSLTSGPAQLTVREADFGDADGPSYATLLVFNAAFHYIAPGVYLGASVDFEPDGQPAANASGDDAAGQDDEDGVNFVLPLRVGQGGSVNVSASTNGLLDAWIDFNGNGDWTDLGEQIFASRPLAPGNNSLQFTIPPSALPHGAVARFRFSTAGGLSFSGGAANGEVEDHLANISPAVDLAVALVDLPDPVLVGSNLHLIVTVTNPGPSPATSVLLREQIPTSTAFVSATVTQGSTSNDANSLVWDIGIIPARSFASADITLTSLGIGVVEHRAEVASAEQELNTTNNAAVQLTTVVSGAGPFANAAYIGLSDFGPATVYPSTLTVSGVTGAVYRVVVTLHGLSHLFPDDLDILLVGPRGQKALVMSDVGGGFDPAFVTFSLDDFSDLILPNDSRIIDEIYQPADYDENGDSDAFAAPAPPGPYTNRLAAFTGTDANGIWSLYIMDDFAQDSGDLIGGWSLDFYVRDPIADASVQMTATPAVAGFGENVTYTLVASNGGPAGISAMLLTNILPANVVLQSFVSSQGQCTHVAGEIRCDFGVLESGGTASLTFVVAPQTVGVLSNYARVATPLLDLEQSNNSASVLTPVRFVADVSLTMRDLQDPAPIGQPVTYTLTVSNLGPQLAKAAMLTNQLPADFNFGNVTTTQGSCANLAGIVFCNLGDLAAGGFATIQISGQPMRLGPFLNSASVSSDNIDGNLTNNQRTEETAVVFFAPPFINTNGIAVPNPYPSTIQVSGLTGGLYKVSVIISNLTHPAPESLQLLLAGPAGENVLLMNAVGGNNPVSGVTLRLDDHATLPLPDSAALTSGAYRPASYALPSSLPAPAPPAPYGSTLEVFRGRDGNGTWSLFTQGGGTIGGWSLEISTLEAVTDLAVGVASQPSAVSVGSNLTYTVTVSNRGPSTATGIVLTNLLPSGFGLTSATGCTNICSIGSLNAGAQVQFHVNGLALSEGLATNVVSAFALERDLNSSNNVGVAVTLMKNPPLFASQPQDLTVTNGGTAQFTVGITGAGPFTYQWLQDGNPVSGATAATLVISNAQQVDAGNYAVRVSDGVGSPLSATARLTVLNRPTITDITNVTILEDTASVDQPFVIADLESAVLTLDITSSNPLLIPPSNVLVSGLGRDRTVRVIPATNQFGFATITITVRDGDGITASDLFDVNVIAVNDAPVLGVVANQVMDEDTQRNILLQASDVEDAPAQLTLSTFVDDTNLLTAVLVDRTLTLAGRPDQFGSTRVRIALRDGSGSVVSNEFDVTMIAINDPPTLDPINPVTVNQRAGLTVVPLSGISSGAPNEPQTLTVRAVTGNSNIIGALTVNYVSGTSGSLSFETVSNLTGSTTITVTVDDGAPSNNTVNRTFGVSIGDTNDPPAISAIADQITAEDTMMQVNFTVADQETAANVLVVTAASSNTNLVSDLGLHLSGTNGTRTLAITPESHASGLTFITVSVTDGHGITVTRTFRLDVIPVNDPPTLEVVSMLVLPVNASTQIVLLTGLGAGAPDEPHDLLISATSSNPSLIPNPIVNYTNPNSSGTLTIEPQTGSGSAVITIFVDDRGASNNLTVRTLTIAVTENNRAPVISRIFNQATPEDTSLDVPFAVSDLESPVDTLALTASSGNTTLIGNENLLITGSGTNRFLRATPALNGSGSATITITATDTNGASSSVTFVLEVTPVNDPPVIANILEQQISEDNVLGPLFFYVDDVETNPNALVLSAASSNPALVSPDRISFAGAGTNRSILILPVQNRSGSTIITVTVRDDEGRSASDTFVLNVQATNDPPFISAIADQTIGMNASVTVPFTINDQETDPALLEVAFSSSNPAILPMTNIALGGFSMNRSVFLNPVPQVTGTSIVSIIVTDSDGLTNASSFALQVTQGSGPPVIVSHPEDLTVTNGDTATLSVLAAGAPVLRYRWRLNGTNLATATNATLVVTNVQASNAGPYTVTVTNSLGSTTSSVALLTVVGSPTPRLNPIADQSTLEDVSLTLNLGLQDSDTPAHLLVLSAASTNTTLVPPSNYLFEGSGFNRTLTIVPASNQFGTNLITITVSDGILTSTRSFVLRVTPVNDAPTLDRISTVSAVANTIVTVPLTGIGPGAPNETTIVNVTAIHNNPNVLTNLAINYTPGASTGSLSVAVLSTATGSATISVTAADGGPTTLRTFQVIIRPAGNQVPSLTGLADVVTAEDTATGPIPFTVNDPDGSASQVTVTAVSANTNIVTAAGISLTVNGPNRTITLRPNTNQFGSSLILLTASDSASGLSTTSFLFTVQSVNDVPGMSGIANQTLYEDTPSAPIPINVRDIETPPGALLLSASSSDQSVLHNTNIVFGGSGSNRVLVLKAANIQTGSATVTLTLADPDGGAISTNFTVTVNATNDTPSISELANITIDVNSSTGLIPFTVWDEETAPGSLSVSAIASDAVLVPPGSITLTGTTSNRTINIQPAVGRTGTSIITISASDGTSTGTRNFMLRVIGSESNAPPTLDPLPDVFVNEDSGVTTINLTGISAGAGGSGQIVAISARSGNRDLVPDPAITYSSPASTGTLTLLPNPGTNGVTTITVTVHDGTAVFSRVFNVIVRARPTLSSIPDIVTGEDVVAAIPFSASDAETPASNLVFAVASSNPTVVPPSNIIISGLDTNRTLTVVGAVNEFGHSVVTLTVTDSDGLSRSNLFAVVINPVNDPPTLAPIATITIMEDQGPVTTNITGITSGASNEAQLLMLDVISSNPGIVPPPAVTYVSPQSTAALTFTPVPNAYGSVEITVTVNDGQSANQFFSRAFEVRVEPVDDLPTLNPIADVVLEYDAGPQTVPLSGISAGNVNETQVVVVTAASSNPALISNLVVSYAHPSSIGTLTLSHNAGISGTAIIMVTVSDGPNSVTQNFQVTVNPPPYPLAVGPIPDQTILEDAVAGPVNFTIRDNGEPGVELSAVSSNPALIAPDRIGFAGSGTSRMITLTPETNQFGVATITVIVRFGDLAASNSFLFTVTAVDDFPFFVQPVADLVMDEDAELEVYFMVDDVETPAGSLVVAATPYNRLLFPMPGSIDWFWRGFRERSIRFMPPPNQFGESVIELRVRDQAFQRTTNFFTVTVRSVNDLPTLSPVPDQAISEDTPLEFGFFVEDVETPASNLAVTVHASDTNLFPAEAFQYVGNGNANARLVRAMPALDRFGTNVITVVVRDSDGGAVSNSFTVRVLPANDPPTISSIAPASTSVGEPTADLPFVIGDLEDLADQLTLSAHSSNTNLAPLTGISLSTTGSNRTVRITPAPAQTGLAVITVQVQDTGGGIAQTSFELLVHATSGPPIIVLQPESQNLFTNDALSLRVLATGPGPLSYQWQLDDVDIPNATDAVFSGVATPSAAGTYRAIISNSNGTAFSQTATVRVYEPARIARITRIGNVTHLAFKTAVSQRYTVEYRDELASGIWQELETIDGTGAEVVIIDSSASGPKRFYRLRIDITATSPNIGQIGPQVTNEDEPITVSFPLQDDRPVHELLVTVSSSDQMLVPNANIVVTTNGSTCTLTILPATNQFGTNTIFVSATDIDGETASRSFLLTVTPVNDLPSITGLSNQLITEDGQKVVGITISDVETVSAALLVAVTSSDTNILPNAGLVISGSGPDRSLAIAPAPDQYGIVMATITITDEHSGVTVASFQVQIELVNDPPTLGEIRDVIIAEDAQMQRIALTEIGAGAANEIQPLNVTASLSNSNLLTNLAIEYASPDSSAFLTFETVRDAFGSAPVTVVVDDGGPSNNVISRSFVVTVNPVNDQPTISAIGDQSTSVDIAVGPLSFTIGDVETPAESLTLSAESSNASLVPPANIVFGGSGANPTVTVSPAAGQSGSATITITVSDGASSATELFVVTVSGPITRAFTNSTPVTVPTIISPGTPYPSTINVSGLGGSISRVTATLNGFTHTWPTDVDVLLVGPDSRKVMLMSDVGGGNPVSGINITLADSGSTTLTISGILSTGTFRPTDAQPGETLPTPAPAGPYGTALSAFNGSSANGTWSLYVYDDGDIDEGRLAGGWTLTITTSPSSLTMNNIVQELSGSAGSRPTRIDAISRVGNTVALRFDTVAMQTYAVEYNDTLDPSGWRTLQNVLGTGATVAVSDSSAAAPMRFYRIRILTVP